MRIASVENEYLNSDVSFLSQIREYVADATVFYTDSSGKQLSRKSRDEMLRDYPSLMKYACPQERPRLAEIIYRGLSGIFRAEGGQLKYLLVMNNGFSGECCALLSLDESGCNSLSGYKSKLEGGQRLVYDVARKNKSFSVSRQYPLDIKKRLSAVNCIEGLGCDTKGDDANQYPLDAVKLVSVIKNFSQSKAVGFHTVNTYTERVRDCFCNISPQCVKALMLMTAFLIRNAKGAVSISSEKCDGTTMKLTFSADIEKRMFFDMYFTTLTDLLETVCGGCEVQTAEEKLIASICLPYTEGTSYSMSDVSEFFELVENQLESEDFGEAFCLLCGA